MQEAAGYISVLDDLRPVDRGQFNAAYEIWKVRINHHAWTVLHLDLFMLCTKSSRHRDSRAASDCTQSVKVILVSRECMEQYAAHLIMCL